MLSVIIPTEGGAKLRSLSLTLQALQASIYRDFEAHVIDNSGADDVHAHLHPFRGGMPLIVHRLLPERGGAAAARNIGVRHAKGRRLLFIDDDCLCPPGLLAAHANAARVALIGLRRHVAEDVHRHMDLTRWGKEHEPLALPDKRKVERIEELILLCSPRINTYAWTCHISYPAGSVHIAGGFPEDFHGSGWEDRALALRCFRRGLRFKLLDFPPVYHLDHPQSARQQEWAPRNKRLFLEKIARENKGDQHGFGV